MKSLSQPLRTLLLALIFISLALWVRRLAERPAAPAIDEEITTPVVRVARENPPTIVEPNENWLDSVPRRDVPPNRPDADVPALR
jgi:hypothetical protein